MENIGFVVTWTFNKEKNSNPRTFTANKAAGGHGWKITLYTSYSLIGENVLHITAWNKLQRKSFFFNINRLGKLTKLVKKNPSSSIGISQLLKSGFHTDRMLFENNKFWHTSAHVYTLNSRLSLIIIFDPFIHEYDICVWKCRLPPAS